MKLLFFIGELSEGGAERVMSLLANHLSSSYDVEILTYYKNDVFYKLNNSVKVSCIEENTGTKSKLRNLHFLKNYIKNYDLIISFLAPFNIYSLIANIGVKVPIIVADRNDPSKIPSNPLLRKLRDLLYNNADYVVVQTKHNKEYFSKSVQDKCIVIGNPIEIGEYKGAALKTNKINKIVNVGRLMPQKNQKMLIEAFSKIANDYPEYRLYIYGDGPIKDDLQNLIDNKKMNQRITLVGKVDNVFEEIKDASIFVLSSDYEGMPNALIEAMCIGLPVISTKVSGANELIEDGKNGILIDVNNEKQLIEKLDLLLSDDQLRTQIAENACKIYDSLNINTIVEKWIEIIENK